MSAAQGPTVAYLDMPSGISGDMFLGCLIAAGWPLDALHAAIAALGLPAGSWSLDHASVQRGALAATLVTVTGRAETTHRHLHDVHAIIEGAALSPQVKGRAQAVFTRLAQAEAAVHGTSVEEVHFHEVGAVDAIVDIVGVCAGLDALGIAHLYAGSFPLGEGWAQSAHGPLPLPAPATLALLAQAAAPTRPAPGPGELVTPTGAALVTELAEFRRPQLRLRHVAVAAGRKEFAWPNIARLWLGEVLDEVQPEVKPLSETQLLEDDVIELSTNIDDMNPELYAAVGDRLFAAGALDVWTTPIQMKKGRPGVLLSVLSPAGQAETLAAILLRETTTLGVRTLPMHRYMAARSQACVETEYGPVQVKLKHVAGELAGVKPEYDACVQLAQTHAVPVRRVVEAAHAAAYSVFLKSAQP